MKVLDIKVMEVEPMEDMKKDAGLWEVMKIGEMMIEEL